MSRAGAETYVIVVRDAEWMRDTWPPDVHLEFLDVVQSAIDFHSSHSRALFLVREVDARR
jgi:hypothetical protein